jgi:hypothetical protein
MKMEYLLAASLLAIAMSATAQARLLLPPGVRPA